MERKGVRCQVHWVGEDNYRWLAGLMVAGALVSVALAVFGMPPVDLNGPLHVLGVMGPTCGMTRAVRHLALGEMSLALRYNPAVPVLPVAVVAVAARFLYGVATGQWLELKLRWRWSPLLTLGAVLVALTVHQQLNSELLR